jgi:hypothetical protein
MVSTHLVARLLGRALVAAEVAPAAAGVDELHPVVGVVLIPSGQDDALEAMFKKPFRPKFTDNLIIYVSSYDQIQDFKISQN